MATVAQDLGIFDAAVALKRRVEPTPLPAEWWVSTCDVMDVTSWSLCSVYGLLSCTCDPTGASRIVPPLAVLDLAVDMLKMNAEAKLSSRDTCAFFAIRSSCAIAEEAVKVESLRPVLLAAGVVEALE